MFIYLGFIDEPLPKKRFCGRFYKKRKHMKNGKFKNKIGVRGSDKREQGSSWPWAPGVGQPHGVTGAASWDLGSAPTPGKAGQGGSQTGPSLRVTGRPGLPGT